MSTFETTGVRIGRTVQLASAVALLFLLLLAGVASAAPLTDAPASIGSDQADYTPGSTVVLTGSAWQPGESVHITVDDQDGMTWSHDADVTADTDGAIQDQFTLPNWFVATYAVKATGSSGTVATSSFTDGNVTFSLATADSVSPGSWSVAYDTFKGTGSTGNLTCAGTGTGSTVDITAGSANVSDATNSSLRPTAVTASNPGYAFTYWSTSAGGTTPATAADLCIPGSRGGTLYAHFKLAKTDQTIAFTAPTGVTYGDADVAPNAAASSGLAVSYASSTPSVCTIASGKIHVVAAGSCTVTASQGGDASFNAAPGVTRTFTIARATLSVAADDQSKVYGDADPSLTSSLSGFKNDDTATSANVTGSASCTLAAGAGPNAGAYKDAITCAPGTLAADNYAFATGAKGTLTITKATLSVTADDNTRTYGDANPPFTGHVTGIRNNDPITGDYTTTAEETSGVGTYPIVAQATATDGSLANYTITTTNGVLTVTKAMLEANISKETVEYGDTPSFSVVSFDGLRNGDAGSVVGGTLHCTPAGTDAGGPYDVACDGLTADNYVIDAYRGGSLTVTKAKLAVNADDKTKVYGTQDPAFTWKLSGFKAPDTATSVSPTGSAACSRDAGSDAGTYQITCAPGDLATKNYSFVTGSTGTLTITKADQAIAFGTLADRTLGAPDIDPGAQASSGLAPSYTASPAATCTIVAGKVHLTGVGTCTVTATQAGNGNYNAAPAVSRSFAVTFAWNGFANPIDNKDAAGNYVMNVAKAGSTIPVKFGLGGDQGLGILAGGAPTTVQIACDAAASQDAVEEYTAATSGLKYDAVANQYVYNWKTSSWAGTCRQLVVRLVDGTEHRANFKFNK